MDNKENVDILKDELTGANYISGHEYDGIQELDNALPKWWVWLFYLTILFSIGYFLQLYVFHTMDNQDVEYAEEIAMAEEKYKSDEPVAIDKTTVTYLTDEASLAAGKIIYDKNCLVCHLSKGEGLVGPNLTDEYWIHGGSIGDIFEITRVGNPSKGMISWATQLSPLEMQQVSSFIMSLGGTNPPNQKAAEGELYKPE